MRMWMNTSLLTNRVPFDSMGSKEAPMSQPRGFHAMLYARAKARQENGGYNPDPVEPEPYDPYQFSHPDPYPNAVIDYGHPLVRCQYCGVHDTALETCPSCGGPRRWY